LAFGRELSLKPMIGKTPIAFNTLIVHNGDSILITSFRAYIVIPTSTMKSVHLLDMEEGLACSIPDEAESVILGIDSIQTVRTDFMGVLDPIHGMFWTWNSGYINVKIEGTSQTSIPLRIPRNTPIKLSIDIAPSLDALLNNHQGTLMSPGKHAHELMRILQRSIIIEQ
jgi:hypothetical protein